MARKAKKRKKKQQKVELSFTKPDNLFKKSQKKRKFIIWLFILLVISLGLSGYFKLRDSGQDDSSLLLKIQADQKVISGSQVTYKIFYQNNDEVSQTKMNLSLTYPDGFKYASSSIEPLNEGQNYWELADLGAGFADILEIRGRLIGDVDEKKQIKAVLAFEPANFSSTFTKETFFEQTISGLKVDMWVDAPSEAMLAQQVQFRIHILNRQTGDWQPLVLSFNKPDQFSILAAEPAASILDNQWEIFELESEEETIITVMGELAPQMDVGRLLFTFELFEEIDGARRLLNENEIPVYIINPVISVDLSLADTKSAVVDWGEIINYELVVKNEGEYVPEDMKLILVFDTNFINWQAWEDTAGLYREDNKIIWDKTHPKIGSKLEGLQPGEEIRLKIGAKLQSAPIDVATLSDSDLLVASVAKVASDIGNEKFVATSDILRTRIGKSFNFFAKAKYYDSEGEPIGDGPLPPQVNEVTTYNIEWNLLAGLDDLKDVSLVMTLPPYVEWLNNQDGYSARFDSSKKELLIATSAFNSLEELTGSFMISVTPAKSQIGQTLVLLNPMTLQATMKSTGEEVIKQINLVDTDLIYDTYAVGKARVVK